MKRNTRKNMSASVNNVYLDSNVFIFAAASTDILGEYCIQIMTSLAKGKITAVTSLTSFDEIFYKLNKLKGFDAAVQISENLLVMPNLVLSELTSEKVAMALKLILKYKLAPRDAIHVATALAHNAEVIVSDDKDFSRVEEIKWVAVADFVKQLS